MTSKHKPCGCLTDGYNWLEECAAHRRIRKSRNELLVTARDLLSASERHIFSDECLAQRDAAREAIAAAEGN